MSTAALHHTQTPQRMAVLPNAVHCNTYGLLRRGRKEARHRIHAHVTVVDNECVCDSKCVRAAPKVPGRCLPPGWQLRPALQGRVKWP